ncbi:MAG TPA: hypothetical protein VEC17_02810, partial [Candidatus Binatia bacterium]|nr:hypothetical protein [Candidatus Binatia bacterium]
VPGTGFGGYRNVHGYYGGFIGPKSGDGCLEHGGHYGQTVGCAREWRNFDGEPHVAAFKVHKTGGINLDNVRVYANGNFMNVASKLDNSWDAKIPLKPEENATIVFTTLIDGKRACFSEVINPSSMAVHLVANRGDEWYFQIPVGKEDFVIEEDDAKILTGIFDPRTRTCSDLAEAEQVASNQ